MRYKKMLVLHNYSFQSWVLYIMYIWERHQSLKKMLKELPLQRRETLYWIVWKFTGVLNISRDNFWTCQLWWNINTRSAERSCLIFSKAWGIVWNWYYKVTNLIFNLIYKYYSSSLITCTISMHNPNVDKLYIFQSECFWRVKTN